MLDSCLPFALMRRTVLVDFFVVSLLLHLVFHKSLSFSDVIFTSSDTSLKVSASIGYNLITCDPFKEKRRSFVDFIHKISSRFSHSSHLLLRQSEVCSSRRRRTEVISVVVHLVVRNILVVSFHERGTSLAVLVLNTRLVFKTSSPGLKTQS